MIRRLSLRGRPEQIVIAEQEERGFRLFETQMYADGYHLLFTDEPYQEPVSLRDLAAEIDEIKARLDKAGIPIIDALSSSPK